MKRFIKDYLTFSKKERVAVIAVLVIVIGISFMPRLMENNSTSITIHDEDYFSKINTDSLSSYSHATTDESQDFISHIKAEKEPSFKKGTLFHFNPNTLDADGWRKLGLNDRVIKTIINYRNKGGKFYKSEDLKRIWGLPEPFYEMVEEYILIPSNINLTKRNPKHGGKRVCLNLPLLK
jgi:DNA uptake protein ComE-like DNA-binding protein